MSNRGGIRGVPPHSAVPAAAPAAGRPTSSVSWRRGDSAAVTVPEPHHRLARPRGVAAPYRPDLTLGGTALDGVDHGDSAGWSQSGWRQVIHRVTGIDLGPGKGARYEQGLRERIATPVGGVFPIAVLNFKGGVGKTAVVEALGSTFAESRGDRVIAVDIDTGDLAERHGRRNPLSLVDLVARNAVTQYSEIRAHTHMNSFGLEVLGLPDYDHTGWRLERRDFAKVFSILRNHYSVVLVDCVKAINSALMEAVLPEARALVVVTGTSIDAVRKTDTTLEWLCNNGYRHLMRSTVLAMNHTEPAKADGVVTKEFESMAARVATAVVLPFDRHVHAGRELGLDRLSKESRRGYLELAAALGDLAAGRSVADAAAPRPARMP